MSGIPQAECVVGGAAVKMPLADFRPPRFLKLVIAAAARFLPASLVLGSR